MSLALPVFFLSAAVLCYETSLVRLLPLSHWQPFVTLALGAALLGFGLSGSVLMWAGRIILPGRRTAFALFAGLAALSFRPVLFAASAIRLEPGLIFRSPSQWLLLALLGAVLTIPFALGALALALPLLERETVGRYYGHNLLGSCLGVVLALAGMETLPLSWLPSLPAALASVACLLAVVPLRRGLLTSLVAAAAAAATLWPQDGFVYGPYKDISYTLRMPGSVRRTVGDSASGLMEVVRASGFRSAAGLSTRYGGPLPAQAGLYRDGDRAGTVLLPAGESDPGLDYLGWQTAAAPYTVMPAGAEAAVVGFDGGEEAVRALRYGVSRVVYVDPHETVAGLPREQPDLFPTWVYADGKVVFDVRGGRTGLLRASGRYGALVFPLGGSLASASVGIGGVAEGFELTAEGLLAALDALGPGGVAAVSGWNQAPPTARLKLLATLAGIPRLRPDGAFGGRVLLVTGWSTFTAVFSAEPLGEAQRKALQEFCLSRGFTLVDGDEAVGALGGEVSAGDWKALDLSHSTDLKPYPWHTLRPVFLWRLMGEGREEAFPRVEWSFLFLVMSLLLSIAASLPLLVLSRPRGLAAGQAMTAMAAFSLLGVGYMVVEVLLIKAAGLLLSPAVVAAAAVLGSMLLASGMGSLASPWVAARPALAKAAFVLAAASAGLSFFSLPLAVGLPFGWRLAASMAAAFLPAFVMGLPFPLFLGRLPGKREVLVPWSWAVSGYFSVIGSALAGVLAVTAGLPWLLALGAGCYLAAGAVWRGVGK